MSEKQKVVVQQRGMGWLGLLGVVFVTLKLLGITAVAEWSWWWVTLPFWAGIALMLGILAVGAIGVGVAFAIAAILDWRDSRRQS